MLAKMKLSAIPMFILIVGCSSAKSTPAPKATPATTSSTATTLPLVDTPPATVSEPRSPTTVDVFVVLREEDYETMFGDGYFAYYSATFRTQADADAFAAIKKAEPVANSNTGYSYHVRSGKLTRGPDGSWSMTAELKDNEQIDVNGDSVKTNFNAVATSLGLS